MRVERDQREAPERCGQVEGLRLSEEEEEKRYNVLYLYSGNNHAQTPYFGLIPNATKIHNEKNEEEDEKKNVLSPNWIILLIVLCLQM